jgi:hypothetical protein
MQFYYAEKIQSAPSAKEALSLFGPTAPGDALYRPSAVKPNPKEFHEKRRTDMLV